MKRFIEFLRESPLQTNAMGASSSVPGTGAIDVYDPILPAKKIRTKKRKEGLIVLKRILTRVPPPL